MTTRGRALAMLGQGEAARAAYAEAATFARGHGLATEAALADLFAVGVPYESGDVEAALQMLDRLDRESAQWPLLLRMRLAYTRGIVQDSVGALDAAEAALQNALGLARASGAPIAIATCESQLATVLLRRGASAAAMPMLRSALAVFERIGRLHDVARLSNVLAVAALWTGDSAMAEEKARQSLRLFEDIGYRAGQSGAADTLGQALLRQGRLDEARRACEVSVDAAGDTAMTFEPRCHLVDIWLRLGHAAEAVNVLSVMAARMEQHPTHHSAARYTLLAGARLAAAIDPARARRWAGALLADPGLDDDLRREAQALGSHGHPRDARPVRWSEFRDEVTSFLGEFRRRDRGPDGIENGVS